MGSINIIKPLPTCSQTGLSINLCNIELIFPRENIFGVTENLTWGCNSLDDMMKLTGDWFIFGTVIGENGDGPVETTCCGIGRTRWEGVGHPGEV